MLSESANVKLLSTFYIEPEELLIAQKRLPLNHQDYVPLMIFDSAFSSVEPMFTRLGGGAVNMSLGRPFGFMQKTGEGGSIMGTQKTDDLVLSPSPNQPNLWLASFKTKEPLTELDVELFSYGLNYYAAYAQAQLSQYEARGSSSATLFQPAP